MTSLNEKASQGCTGYWWGRVRVALGGKGVGGVCEDVDVEGSVG